MDEIKEPWDDPYDGHRHVWHKRHGWCLKCGVERKNLLYTCPWCGKSWRSRFFYLLHWSWFGEVR